MDRRWRPPSACLDRGRHLSRPQWLSMAGRSCGTGQGPPCRAESSRQPQTQGRCVRLVRPWRCVGGVSGSDGAIVGANRPEFADQVDRLNLADGTWATWFRAPADRWVRILGVDADGHPLLGLEEPPAIVGKIAYPHEPDELLLLLTGPGQTMTIAGAAAGLRPRAANTDSHGSWITASGSLWLYRNGTVSRVANIPDGLYPALRRPSFPPDVPHGQVGADLVFSGPRT